MRYNNLDQRLKRLERNRPERLMTLAERITRLVEIKHKEDCQRAGLGDDFDWDRAYARVRQMIIDRGRDPDEPY